MPERFIPQQDTIQEEQNIARARQWEAAPEQLPIAMAMTSGQDPYLEAQRRAAEAEERDGTANAKPALVDMTEEKIEQEKRGKIERIGEEALGRIRRALGGIGLRFA